MLKKADFYVFLLLLERGGSHFVEKRMSFSLLLWDLTKKNIYIIRVNVTLCFLKLFCTYV